MLPTAREGHTHPVVRCSRLEAEELISLASRERFAGAILDGVEERIAPVAGEPEALDLDRPEPLSRKALDRVSPYLRQGSAHLRSSLTARSI